ncbi:hypothetical protein ACFQ5D_10655 [Paenibacillus farraposensis]|uniref:Uncharacterized protein n=1 Tax=Paenibacillus farraposensis TaxID=2807095 RepID=A0ABW4DF98_9BACL|nr:hypothetical protein [Paenibacillus farraposensis]MCC3380681.1 hypothetical protein [Paenibacillus farraposensis]
MELKSNVENSSPVYRSSIPINKAIRVHDERTAECVKEVLALLGSKGCTVGHAIFILKKAQEAATDCTIMQNEYTNDFIDSSSR